MNFSNANYRRWSIQGTIGILLFGSGICMLMEAGFYKHTEPAMWKWVMVGTFSLIVLMSGLILMVDSIRYRMAYDQEKNKA
jgi:hypothetical protein